jgi:hypothetical protein
MPRVRRVGSIGAKDMPDNPAVIYHANFVQGVEVKMIRLAEAAARAESDLSHCYPPPKQWRGALSRMGGRGWGRGGRDVSGKGGGVRPRKAAARAAAPALAPSSVGSQRDVLAHRAGNFSPSARSTLTLFDEPTAHRLLDCTSPASARSNRTPLERAAAACAAAAFSLRPMVPDWPARTKSDVVDGVIVLHYSRARNRRCHMTTQLEQASLPAAFPRLLFTHHVDYDRVPLSVYEGT